MEVADPIAALITAVRAVAGPDVCDASVTLLPSGAVSIYLRTHGAGPAVQLAAGLGCGQPELVGDGRSEWICAERWGYDDQVSLTVTGGHRPVCQCAAAIAARGDV